MNNGVKIETILRPNIPPNWRYCMSSCNLLHYFLVFELWLKLCM